MEVVEEEIQCIEEDDFANVGPAACTGPQKRPTQATGHGGPSFVQRFGSDQQRIDSYRRSVEAAEEEVLSMEENVFGNVRPTVCTRPPKRLAQTKGRARPSCGQHFGSDLQGIGSYRRSMDAA